MNVRPISETATTVTVEWDPTPGQEGYIPTIDGSQTLTDGKRHAATSKTVTKTTIHKPADGLPHEYGIILLGATDHGSVVVPAPAPPPVGAFMSYPASQPQTFTGRTDLDVSRLSFQGFHQNTVVLNGCHNINLLDLDFDDCGGSSNGVIYLYKCTGILDIARARFREPGFHAIQLNGCTMTGRIHDCKVKGAARTEDIISLYASGGLAADPFTVEDNQLEGGDYGSASGSGIMVGDNGGAHIVVRNNHLLNPGAVGIGVAGGSDILVDGNTVYGKQMPLSNVGVYAWHQNGPPSTDVTLTNNKVDWRNAAGQRNGFWNGPNTPATQSGNEWNATIDPATLAVTL